MCAISRRDGSAVLWSCDHCPWSRIGPARGANQFSLQLNDAQIEVCIDGNDDNQRVTLLSPETWAGDLDSAAIHAGLNLFGLSQSDLHPQLRPALGSSGEDGCIFLHDREVLARMQYDFELGRQVMDAHGWMMANLIVPESDQLFHARVAFAPGGVVEDPATGAAAAGLAEVLRAQNWPHGGAFFVHLEVTIWACRRACLCN